MIEYRTDRVSPEEEENMMTLRTAFGWQFMNASEVYNQSQRITGISARAYGQHEGFIGGVIDGMHAGGPDIQATVHSTTDTTNYVTLYFARNTAIPGYEKIKQLERESWYFIDKMCYPKKPKLFAILLTGYILLMIAAAIGVFSSGDSPEPIDLILIVPFVILLIGHLIQRSVYRRKERKNNMFLRIVQDRIAQAQKIMEGE